MPVLAKVLNYLAIASISIMPLHVGMIIKQSSRIYVPHFDKIGISENLPSITRLSIRYSESSWPILLGLLLTIVSGVTLTLMMRSDRARNYLPLVIVIIATFAFLQLATCFIALTMPLITIPTP